MAFTLESNELCLLKEKSGRDVMRVLNDAILVINEWTDADRGHKIRELSEDDNNYNRYPWWGLEKDSGTTRLSTGGLLIATRLLLLCFIPSEGGYNADGMQEYNDIAMHMSVENAIALYKLRQFTFNTTRFLSKQCKKHQFAQGQAARLIQDAEQWRKPLKDMILGVFTQPNSFYDNGTIITRKGPTMKGTNPNAVPGQLALSLNTWDNNNFALHKDTGLGIEWKDKAAMTALSTLGFREAPFTRDIIKSRTYTNIDRHYWENKRKEDAKQAVRNNRPPLFTP